MEKKVNPCDTCKDININNHKAVFKKSNYKPLKDIVLYNESGVETEKLYCTCSSCEYSEEFKRIYKRRIEDRIKIRPEFKNLYDNLSKTEPQIVKNFEEVYRDMGLKIDFNSEYDYRMFKFYISEYNKRNKGE